MQPKNPECLAAVLSDVRDDRSSLAMIARRHGVSPATVWRWSNHAGVKRRLGRKRLLPPKGWQSDFETGMTLAALTAKYRLSAHTMTSWRRAAGLKSRRRGRRRLTQPAAWHREVLELVKTSTQAAVGRRLGIPRQSVRWAVMRWRATTRRAKRKAEN